ncbi:hypothetical protein CsSME_00017956 [Camellia sinensis var. sinensis]
MFCKLRRKEKKKSRVWLGGKRKRKCLRATWRRSSMRNCDAESLKKPLKSNLFDVLSAHTSIIQMLQKMM